MSSSNVHSYTTDHPHAHHNHDSAAHTSPKSHAHRMSISSPLPHLTTLTHAPTVFLSGIHRHEREIVANHQERAAKREAEKRLDKQDVGLARRPSSSPSSPASDAPPKWLSGAARAAIGAGASEQDEAEWAAIVAARAAATKRSPTLDLEKEMAAAAAEEATHPAPRE